MDIRTFRFVGGRYCLDFTATMGRRYDGGVERLAASADLVDWLRESGLFDGATPAPEAVLDEAHRLREAIYRLAHPATRGAPDAADVETVNSWSARPGYAVLLTPGARGAVQRAPEGSEAAEAGLAEVARDAVGLLTGGQLERVRECARSDCSLLFLDASTPGKRRWCDMVRCGNQTKASRHRSRQREERHTASRGAAVR